MRLAFNLCLLHILLMTESCSAGAKFCYGAQGVNGTYDYVPGSEVYVTSTQMCAITNSNSTETITESGTLPSLYIKDIHDILNTAWTAEVEADEFDITGYFLKGTPATGTIDQLNLATNNKWAWSNRLFYFGLPSEWYLIFTAGLLSPKVQCYELTVKSTAACPENSEGIRTVARSATTTTDHTTETWNLGSSREEGYIASEIGGGTEDWPQQLKRDTDGAYFVANYKWMDDALILLAFALLRGHGDGGQQFTSQGRRHWYCAATPFIMRMICICQPIVPARGNRGPRRIPA